MRVEDGGWRMENGGEVGGWRLGWCWEREMMRERMRVQAGKEVKYRRERKKLKGKREGMG